MAEGLNRVYLIGALSERPELRYTRRGRPVLRMRLGVTERPAPGQEAPEQLTQWHDVVVPGRRAESLASVVGPGTVVLVEGTLRSRSYPARDGSKRTRYEVVARHVWLLSGVARASRSRPGSVKGRFGGPGSTWDEPAFSDDGQGKLF